MTPTPPADLRSPPTEVPAPVTIVNGPGVLGEQPVIQHADPPTITLPMSPRRRVVETAVLFIATILFLRSVTVEPFGVPTGSMAPALSGNHRAIDCPQCGFPVRAGDPTHKQNGYPDVHCPNCGLPGLAVASAPEIAGDRLLVDKNVFRLRPPRRWEVAVFICPVDKSKPYVKRVVGLPGEQVQIRDGDIWVNGELSRKSLAQARECEIPVFLADFVPPDGWHRRWLADPAQPVIGSAEPVAFPDWLVLDRNELRVAATGSPAPRLAAYWHVDLADKTPVVIRDSFEYNGHGSPLHDWPVHDFILEFEAEVLGGTGSVVCQMTDGADTALAHLAAGAEAGPSRLLVGGGKQVRAADHPPLAAGKRHQVVMAFVDRRVTVAVDGTEYFAHDLPPAVSREDVSSPFRVGGQGIDLVVRHIRLYRDIYYRTGGKHACDHPLALGPDEYFVLGDNSANSDDSRSWQIPGVAERSFLGKPFLLHQPSRPARWEVGGRSGHAQAIDWGRVRWLR